MLSHSQHSPHVVLCILIALQASSTSIVAQSCTERLEVEFNCPSSAGLSSNETVLRNDICGTALLQDCSERYSNSRGVYPKVCKLGSVFSPCAVFEQDGAALPTGVHRCDDTVCVDMCKVAAQNPDIELPSGDNGVDVCQFCPEQTRNESVHLSCEQQKQSQNASGCPFGWFKVADFNEPIGRCYFRSPMGSDKFKQTWEEAHSECAQRGATLASMDALVEWQQLVHTDLVPTHHRAASAYWITSRFNVSVDKTTGDRALEAFIGSNLDVDHIQIVQGGTATECQKNLSMPILAIGSVEENTLMCIAMVFQHSCAFWKATQCSHSRQYICERDAEIPTEMPSSTALPTVTAYSAASSTEALSEVVPSPASSAVFSSIDTTMFSSMDSSVFSYIDSTMSGTTTAAQTPILGIESSAVLPSFISDSTIISSDLLSMQATSSNFISTGEMSTIATGSSTIKLPMRSSSISLYSEPLMSATPSALLSDVSTAELSMGSSSQSSLSLYSEPSTSTTDTVLLSDVSPSAALSDSASANLFSLSSSSLRASDQVATQVEMASALPASSSSSVSVEISVVTSVAASVTDIMPSQVVADMTSSSSVAPMSSQLVQSSVMSAELGSSSFVMPPYSESSSLTRPESSSIQPKLPSHLSSTADASTSVVAVSRASTSGKLSSTATPLLSASTATPLLSASSATVLLSSSRTAARSIAVVPGTTSEPPVSQSVSPSPVSSASSSASPKPSTTQSNSTTPVSSASPSASPSAPPSASPSASSKPSTTQSNSTTTNSSQDTSEPGHHYPPGYPTDVATNSTDAMETPTQSTGNTTSTDDGYDEEAAAMARMNVIAIAVMSLVAFLVVMAVVAAIIIYVKTSHNTGKIPVSADDEIITNFSSDFEDTPMREFSSNSTNSGIV
ncbi:uncharacterized protein LOC135822279 [Sycon ciliatum]|uniref:uncharacterized protein LOC135822279 n=1 Tax=Sycon ciliatum TaxID=27933 RepID=UPI0031F61F78